MFIFSLISCIYMTRNESMLKLKQEDYIKGENSFFNQIVQRGNSVI